MSNENETAMNLRLDELTSMFQQVQLSVGQLVKKVVLTEEEERNDVPGLTPGMIDEESEVSQMTIGLGDETYHGIGSELKGKEALMFRNWMKMTEKALSHKRANVLTESSSFVAWKNGVVAELTMVNLLTALTDPKSVGAIDAMSPLRRNQWKFVDLLLVAYLIARMGEKQKAACAECKSAAAIWVKLHEKYASQTASSQHKLTDQWGDMIQREGESVEDFIERLNYLAMNMSEAGIPRTDQERRHRLLKGLNSEYDIERRIYFAQELSYESLCRKFMEMPMHPRGESNKIFQGPYKVHEQAHLAKGRMGGVGGQTGGQRTTHHCLVCGGSEHMTWDCPSGLTRNKDARGQWIPRCFNCMEEGHISRYCKLPKKPVWGHNKERRQEKVGEQK
jgi:hypothetical protein